MPDSISVADIEAFAKRSLLNAVDPKYEHMYALFLMQATSVYVLLSSHRFEAAAERVRAAHAEAVLRVVK